MNAAHTMSLLRKIDPHGLLRPEERAALLSLPLQLATLDASQDIVRAGDRPTRSCLLIEGFLCAWKMVGSGERQIASLYVPGDIPDLQSLHLEVMDIGFSVLGRAQVGFIRHEALDALCVSYPRISAALWRTTLIDAAIYRDWVANVGQRPAEARAAHLICEVVVRLKAVGLAADYSCEFPLTQSDLGDALGLSTVHLNRTMSKLRREGLFSLHRKRLRVLDWPRLKTLADFDPTYLHLKNQDVALT